MSALPPGFLNDPRLNAMPLVQRLRQHLPGTALQRAQPPQPTGPPTLQNAFNTADWSTANGAIDQAVQNAQSEVQALTQQYSHFQPNIGPDPQYTPPPVETAQLQPPNRGFEAGALLAAMFGGRSGMGAAAGNQLNYDTAQREKQYDRDAAAVRERNAAAQRAAEMSYDQQNSAANRRATLAAQQEAHMGHMLDSAENRLEKYHGLQEKSVHDHAAAVAAQTRTDAYVKSLFARDQQGWARIRETAKRDAENYGIKQTQVAQAIRLQTMRDATQMYDAGLRATTAWNIAQSRERLQLLDTKIKENLDVWKTTTREKGLALRNQIQSQLHTINGIIQAAQQPNAPDTLKAQAEELFKPGGAVESLEGQIKAETGGQFSLPTLTPQTEIDNITQEMLSQPTDQIVGGFSQAPNVNVTVNTPGAQTQNPALGYSALTGNPGGAHNPNDMSDILSKWGLAGAAPHQTPNAHQQPHVQPNMPPNVPPHQNTPPPAANPQTFVQQAHAAYEQVKGNPQLQHEIVLRVAKQLKITPAQAEQMIAGGAPAPQPKNAFQQGLDALGGMLHGHGGSNATARPPQRAEML